MMTTKLTHEQIDAMKAGREMDALVAELVMGWEETLDRYGNKRLETDIHWKHDENQPTMRLYVNDWKWSTDIAAAWQVVEKSTGFQLENRQNYVKKEWYCEISFDDKPYGFTKLNEETAPIAICRAALKAVTDE